jgi:hypothetical protein
MGAGCTHILLSAWRLCRMSTQSKRMCSTAIWAAAPQPTAKQQASATLDKRATAGDGACRSQIRMPYMISFGCFRCVCAYAHRV